MRVRVGAARRRAGGIGAVAAVMSLKVEETPAPAPRAYVEEVIARHESGGYRVSRWLVRGTPHSREGGGRAEMHQKGTGLRGDYSSG